MYFRFIKYFRHEPLKIFTNAWYSEGMVLSTSKAPTAVLFDPDGKFEAFGFEADEKYSNLVDEESSDGWYYFQNFKMELYKQAVNIQCMLYVQQI